MVYTHRENTVNAYVGTEDALRAFLSSDAEEKYRPLKPAVTRLLEDFCDPALSVCALADEAHMSKTYFRKLFGDLFNTNPKKALSCLRLHYAEALLTDGTYSVETVAGMVGFANAKYFSKLFKKELGLSPSQYKARQKIE